MSVDSQRAAMDAEVVATREDARWNFHYTTDALIRYVRDRRLNIALQIVDRFGRLDPANQTALLVCGGVGGEGTFLVNRGFSEVTVSDLSGEALEMCRALDPRLHTTLLNAEEADSIPDGSYDIVLVQDGLHHLPRPVLGFTEMLRIARVAVIVIEPHWGLVGRRFGTEWEVHGHAVNYVFRWNRALLEQATRSYLLSRSAIVVPHRIWDHTLIVSRIAKRFPRPMQRMVARALYLAATPFNRWGNMMVGVVLKSDEPIPERLVGHG